MSNITVRRLAGCYEHCCATQRRSSAGALWTAGLRPATIFADFSGQLARSRHLAPVKSCPSRATPIEGLAVSPIKLLRTANAAFSTYGVAPLTVCGSSTIIGLPVNEDG